jgi:hypothetical protein
MKEVLNMKKFMATLLVISFIGCGTLAFAGDGTIDCDCKKGGLGLKLGNFVIGFGARTYNSQAECSKAIGPALLLGSASNCFIIGVNYNEGVIGVGFAYKGPEKTSGFGIGLGYDYSDCRMVWPYEE